MPVLIILALGLALVSAGGLVFALHEYKVHKNQSIPVTSSQSSNPNCTTSGLTTTCGSPTSGSDSTSTQPTKSTSSSTPQQTSGTPKTDTAPTSNTVPTYSAQDLYCIAGDSGKNSLDNGYEETDQSLAADVQSVFNEVNSSTITGDLGIQFLNEDITASNQGYNNSYQTYLAGRQKESCSVDVAPPVDIPQCANDTLALCIGNINNNDTTWTNLVNVISGDEK
jgi:hypothetical protein